MTHAAQQFHLSPGAVSLQLPSLSDELLAELFVRSGKRLVATPAAVRLAKRAEVVVRTISQIQQEFADDASKGVRPSSHRMPGAQPGNFTQPGGPTFRSFHGTGVYVALDHLTRDTAAVAGQQLVAIGKNTGQGGPGISPFVEDLFEDPRIRMLGDETSPQQFNTLPRDLFHDGGLFKNHQHPKGMRLPNFRAYTQSSC